jgi:hypothetical protein
VGCNAECLATLFAALIGALFGSVGAVIVENLYARRSEESRKREVLVQRYLYRLQDAAESLLYRLRNLGGGEPNSDSEENEDHRKYRETTMLYALGRVLAVERIFALEAVYPQLDIAYRKLWKKRKLGEKLKQLRIDDKWNKWGAQHFYKYQRISLAEAAIEREGEQFRPSTYLEFRRKFDLEGSVEHEWLEPAREAVSKFSQQKTPEEQKLLQDMRNSLVGIVMLTSEKTHIRPSWEATSLNS